MDLSVLSCLLLEAIFLVNALFFGGGDGDCILAFAMGVSPGSKAGLTIILISCLLLLVYCLISGKRSACPKYHRKNRKGTLYKVLKHEGNQLTISIYNKKAVNTYP